MDYHALHKLTVSRLREMAAEDPELEGVSGLSKDQLVDLLCARMGIEKPHRVATGTEKSSLKRRIRELKEMREQAIAAGDRDQIEWTRQELHKVRHRLRKTSQLRA